MQRRSFIIIIIAAVGAVLAIGAGATYWFMVARPEHAKAAAVKPKKALFVSLAPMVVNIQANGQFGLGGESTYLQIGFEFSTVRKHAIKAFKSIQPAIRGNVLALMLDASPEILVKKAARDRLRARVLALVNTMLVKSDHDIGAHPFSHAYLTNFVTQPG